MRVELRPKKQLSLERKIEQPDGGTPLYEINAWFAM